MKTLKKIKYDNIGIVNFVLSKRARRLRIRLQPFKEIRVTVPPGASLKQATTFLDSRQDWILKKIPNIREIEKEILAAQKNKQEINIDEAINHLHGRLVDLANKHLLNFNKLTFRNQKTRWGSCSPKNNLSINIKLYNLPDELQDYVLLHELVHTEIKNHGPQFWQRMERLLPQARKLDKELKKYKILAL